MPSLPAIMRVQNALTESENKTFTLNYISVEKEENFKSTSSKKTN